MSLVDLISILSYVYYPGFEFAYGTMGEGYFVQVKFVAPDSRDKWDPVHGEPESVAWSGRKWYISRYSTRSEIVNTCFKAVITALEHEAREQFKYKGVSIYQPHMDVEVLREVAQEKVTREPPIPIKPTMPEMSEADNIDVVAEDAMAQDTVLI